MSTGCFRTADTVSSAPSASAAQGPDAQHLRFPQRHLGPADSKEPSAGQLHRLHGEGKREAATEEFGEADEVPHVGAHDFGVPWYHTCSTYPWSYTLATWRRVNYQAPRLNLLAKYTVPCHPHLQPSQVPYPEVLPCGTGAVQCMGYDELDSAVLAFFTALARPHSTFVTSPHFLGKGAPSRALPAQHLLALVAYIRQKSAMCGTADPLLNTASYALP